MELGPSENSLGSNRLISSKIASLRVEGSGKRSCKRTSPFSFMRKYEDLYPMVTSPIDEASSSRANSVPTTPRNFYERTEKA